MNEAERLENAYRAGQNDGWDNCEAKLSERIRRLERALADLVLYTHTLCRDLRADVGTVENARMFQRAKHNTQAFAIAIGAELAKEGVELVPKNVIPKNVKLDEKGNGGGLL